MGKKPATKLSMAELAEKFGGTAGGGVLPTQSEGKEFGKGDKGKGKGGGGFRDRDDDSRADGADNWRGGKGGGGGGFGGGGGKGGDRDGGGFGGGRRDQADTRADTGDWFTKEKPAGGGGDDRPRGGGGGGGDRGGERRAGGGGFGDREGGGGGGMGMRRNDAPGKDEGDNNWRGGDRPERSAGGGGDRDRDRDGGRGGGGDRGGFGGDRGGGNRRGGDDDDATNWRDRPARETNRDDGPRRQEEAAPERKRLMLKPKSGTEEKDDTKVSWRDKQDKSEEAGKTDAAPWRKSTKKQDDDEPEVDEDGFEVVKKGVGAKFVAPSGTKAAVSNVKEEPKKAAKKQESSDEESEDAAPARKAEESEEGSDDEEAPKKEAPKKEAAGGAKDGKWESPSAKKRREDQEAADKANTDKDRKRDDDRQEREADRRKRDEDERKPAPKTGGGGGAGGKYVPAHMRKEVEAENARAKERAEKEEAADKIKREKNAAEKEAKDAQKARLKEEKDSKARGGTDKPQAAPKDSKKGEDAGSKVNQKKLSEFGEKCKAAIDNAKAKVKDLVDEVDSLLTDAELQTVHPVRQLLEPLIGFCRSKADKEVISAVERFAPLMKCLIKKAEIWRFKVQLLCEAQRVTFEMGLPRLSPASALIEVFFDGLYQAEVIEEKYFEFWTMHSDDTPGKTKAMFQLNDFLEWLRNAKVEGETDSEEEEEQQEKKEDEDEDEEDEEDEDDEDLKNFTDELSKRGGGRPMAAR